MRNTTQINTRGDLSWNCIPHLQIILYFPVPRSRGIRAYLIFPVGFARPRKSKGLASGGVHFLGWKLLFGEASRANCAPVRGRSQQKTGICSGIGTSQYRLRRRSNSLTGFEAVVPDVPLRSSKQEGKIGSWGSDGDDSGDQRSRDGGISELHGPFLLRDEGALLNMMRAAKATSTATPRITSASFTRTD